ncbi:MAG: 30S ribosomal protein S20 [Rhodothalassiaceae bacterium]
MANSPQARKRVRQNEKRRLINRARMSRIRSFVKKVELAIQSGDQTAAREALSQAQPELMRGAAKGVMHKNAAARKLARLNARVKTMTPVA